MDEALLAPLRRLPYHLGIATGELERARDRLGAVFGVQWSAVRTTEGHLSTVGAFAGPTRRLHSLGGPLRMELIEGTPASVWATTEVATLHHYAYYSADVASEVETLVAEGWSVEMATVDDLGRPTVFAYLVKPGHIRIELVDQSLHADYEALVGVAVPMDVASAF
jgi:Glyoxalase/Bleomycin resistance protein/Dioxygenase superfamily